eukprot:TRINITY_DN6727_c0_g1_i2.p1 TRINITY_DN6727_c0_g1~~TRINITY_DN6727_c0_g1_i2.p1  ORF type:complete len:197 (-),score=32.70 TRINITY_DN6727_c0_g1_i2:181-750(-)
MSGTATTAGVDVVVIPPPAGGVADSTTTNYAPTTTDCAPTTTNDTPTQPKPSLYRQMTKRNYSILDDFPWYAILAVLVILGIFIFFTVAGALSMKEGSCSYSSKNKYGKLVSVDVATWTIVQGAVPLGCVVIGAVLIYIADAVDCPEQLGMSLITSVLGGMASMYLAGMITQFIALTRENLSTFCTSCD